MTKVTICVRIISCLILLPMGMVGEVCLPSNAYYPRTPDYTFILGSMSAGLNNLIRHLFTDL